MTLEILISTIDGGINKISEIILPYRSDVKYIVSLQYQAEKYIPIPIDLIREDVLVSQIPGKGVTKSRNNALSLAVCDIGLFSDDDVSYTGEYLDKILKIFMTNPSLDVAIFKIKTPPECTEYKDYPLYPIKLSKLPFSVGTIEIAFRTKIIQDKQILFDERFGAGQPLFIGSDENIFILDCIKKGLNVWFFPEYVVNHPYESTIKSLQKYDIRRVSVGGAFDARINGWISIPKTFWVMFKLLPDLIRNNKNPLIFMKERLSASIYILFTKSKK